MTLKGASRRPVADVIEDVEWILEHDRYATATVIAPRLGYRTKSGLQQALKSRPDLLDRLTSNAERAGFSVTRPSPGLARPRPTRATTDRRSAHDAPDRSHR